MNAIELVGLRKTFGKVVAVEQVDLSVPLGIFCGLIGHNGAGKSTTLAMLLGLLPPTEGTVMVCGIDVVQQPLAARKNLGAVPEEPALYEYLSAREFFEFVAEVREGGDVGRALEVANLGEASERLIREYSQGMRRRTALAAAMIGEPKVLVLDEALNGLDPPSMVRMKEILANYVHSGKTVILSTHVVDTVAKVADRVVMMAHGRIVVDAEVSRLEAGGLERLFLEKLAETHHRIE